VAEVLSNDTLILQGRDGLTFQDNVKNCAPCHIPGIDGHIDPSLAPRDYADIPCEWCYQVDSEAPNLMLLCDTCGSGWHQKCLQPPVVKIPPATEKWFCPYCEARATTTSGAEPVTDTDYYAVPTDGRLTSPAAVMANLKRHMPGPWTKGHASRLFNCLPGNRNFLQSATGLPERVLTVTNEFTHLVDHVVFDKIKLALDPWSGTGSTAHTLRADTRTTHVNVILSDADYSVGADHYGNALDPTFMNGLRAYYANRIDVIVTSPWFAMLDLALPTMINIATRAVFCHVPGHYLTNMPHGRRDWIRQLIREGRVHALSNLPVGPYGRACVWLCIFKTRADKSELLRPRANGREVFHVTI
jgi:hypothetical protein